MGDDKEDYIDISDFYEKDVDEKAAIDMLLSDLIGTTKIRPNFYALGNFGYREIFRRNTMGKTGIYCLKNFLVKDIGLKVEGKPGEIDILLIPFVNDKVFYEMCAVVEVKVARPTAEKPRRGANSDGFSQVMGLVRAGFPYVGLIHVILSKPVPDHLKQKVKMLKRPVDAVEEPGKPLPGIDEFEIVKVDWLPLYGQDTQWTRLLSYDIPKYVGLKVISYNFRDDNSFSSSFPIMWSSFEGAFLNPQRKKAVVRLIKAHHENNSDKYLKIDIDLSKY